MRKHYSLYRDFAWIFDALYGEKSRDRDREFYFDAARRKGGPVLEVACGVGRNLAPMLGGGIDVYGIDTSAEMLDHARGRLARTVLSAGDKSGAFTLVRQDQAALHLPRRFPLIILPWNAYLNLTSVDQRQAFLAGVTKYLAPRGEMVMDVDLLEFDEESQWGPWVESARGTRARTRKVVSISPCASVREESFKFEVETDGGIREKSTKVTLAHLSGEEVMSEVASSGLEVTDVSSTFAGREFTSKDHAQRLVLTARRSKLLKSA